jgi:hypothetical protein
MAAPGTADQKPPSLDDSKMPTDVEMVEKYDGKSEESGHDNYYDKAIERRHDHTKCSGGRC